VAEVVGFELRNVVANYSFERSHRFAGIQPNSGHRDYSRLSCGVGQMQLGLGPASEQAFLRGVWSSSSSLSFCGRNSLGNAFQAARPSCGAVVCIAQAIILAAALFHAVHASTVSSIFGSGSGALGFFNLPLLF
jgi:hypothetical protein